MATTDKNVEVLVKGKPVEFSFRVLKNGGAVIGLRQKALDTKASAKAKPSTTKKAPKKAAKATKLVDGVRFDGDEAIIRINGADVENIPKPKVPSNQKPMKQWKKAINSNLWNAQGGAKDEAIWAHKVGYGDMPTE